MQSRRSGSAREKVWIHWRGKGKVPKKILPITSLSQRDLLEPLQGILYVALALRTVAKLCELIKNTYNFATQKTQNKQNCSNKAEYFMCCKTNRLIQCLS